MGKPTSQTEETEMKNAIIFIIALAVSGIALAESHAQIHGKYAAPFGLEWGMSKEQVMAMGVRLTPDSLYKDGYKAPNLLKSLPDGEEHILTFKPRFGLVSAKVLTSHLFGVLAGKERYSELKTVIANKYGKPLIENERMDDARWNEDSVKFYECLLGDTCGQWKSHWGNDADGTIELRLSGSYVSRDAGFIVITYKSAAWYVVNKREKAWEEKKKSREKEIRARKDTEAL